MTYKYNRLVSIRKNRTNRLISIIENRIDRFTDLKSAYLTCKVVNGFNTSRLHFIQNDIMNNLI